MDAPERIYVKINHPISSEYTEIIAFEEGDGIEYIRTDAFIKKAFEFFREHLWEYINVKNANCDTFINIDGDKLEEDFRDLENKLYDLGFRPFTDEW